MGLHISEEINGTTQQTDMILIDFDRSIPLEQQKLLEINFRKLIGK
ncbi:hypothetical protein QQ054_21550 [Oscillatoria amoena NRMC-F 0135]|nr:hypothetical protein [Oscillatoria amoena NRMC-F 0135]